MNLLEYVAKEILAREGVPVPQFGVASSPDEAFDVAVKLNKTPLVVKAQIAAGGRGKGRFADGYEGGVKICKTTEEVREVAAKMLGGILVTAQTGPVGQPVRKVIVTESVNIVEEIYLSLTYSYSEAAIWVMGSRLGGVEIERIALENPQAFVKKTFLLDQPLWDFQLREFGAQLGFKSKSLVDFSKILKSLFQAFIKHDATLCEINPLAIDRENRFWALDAKISIDDNSLFRHDGLSTYRFETVYDSQELEALSHGVNYVGLDGQIGCLVNGAGLAMATMDILARFGGRPANFLDVGGGADQNQVEKAFRVLLSHPNLKVILINIFGGIMRCDLIAEAIVEATKKQPLHVPLVIRLEGTRVKEGKEILEKSSLQYVFAEDLEEAAKKAVNLVEK
ncbi:ADP-forming succinate--CoA ligase subunit beta [Methylacidiphilum caldifontis]|uniref:ADP-forming succinate--CoA ligase subunit beta n=1 Tax=Methylacidiphilum caldifontis TaxID=2795386 RepID=UPI001A8D5ED1|nr:ADP-forming succinate--CoA ligase subunit beta [Methylacidiphilum caldifontis]QSR88996.1 ADP-forming succinate--CoA ligase subunit beta [Methylacidiphilum caldifontis]